MTSDRPRTIVTALDEAAETSRRFVFHHGQDTVELPYDDLRARARERAGALAAWGVQPGDAVGILGPNTPEWVTWAFAAWVSGCSVVPIPFGARITDLGEYVARLQRLVEAAGCRAVLADPRFVPALPEGVAHAWGGPLPATDRNATTYPGPDDLAVLQFTSGTTSEPKIAELSHGGIIACVESFLGSFEIRADDVSLSWLPFFHDNGLFGHMIGPVVARVDGMILPTERFARQPALWFRLAGEVGATLTSGPCSAWAVTLKAALKSSEQIDLSSLRMGIFGAEAIDPAVIDRFEEDAAGIGLRPGTLVGAYGLAEATLVVTVGSPGGGVRIDRVGLDELSNEGEAVPVPEGDVRARRIASCGSPSSVSRVRIAGPDGPVPDRHVGEIQLAGPGLMNGYRGLPPDQQPFTTDGWLLTGDAGYLADGELFMTGRMKDLVIVFGRNYAPEEFEWAAQQVEGVRPGRCVAFATEGEGEGHAVVVFELAAEAEPEETAAEVRRRISSMLGVALGDAFPAVKGTIRKTTSGKLQRGHLREAYARGELVRAATDRG